MTRMIRQLHRWLSMLFTLVVAGIFAMLGLGIEVPQWLYMLPLAPLFLLMASGLWLFAQPYLRRGAAG
ncbi:hypothetical protein [Pseudooceanicola sp. LIPI14-2-Ac024]|uniref:hypothetical protein n=1 Tax=Pseudooceanicola sp. LIPI14-2-Ac024 TaxID=3344875 RepID=UPI0035D0E895